MKKKFYQTPRADVVSLLSGNDLIMLPASNQEMQHDPNDPWAASQFRD